MPLPVCAERKITMNIDISTSEKLHEYLMSLVEREKRTGVPSSAEELAPAIEEMFRQQAELQRRLDKLSKRKKIPFNNNVPILLSDKYKTLATEDQVAIFGALCLHLVMAVDSARNGDFKEANLHMITGGMEQEEANCPSYMELWIAISRFIDALRDGIVSFDTPEETA